MNTPISKELYLNSKRIVQEYEKNERKLSTILGSSNCPFCGGTKTKPFVSSGKSQYCTDCDKNGKISNRKLVEKVNIVLTVIKMVK